MHVKVFSIVISLFLVSHQLSAQTSAKSNAEIVSKVKVLLAKMTLSEKIAELTQDAPANKRLGIPLMTYSECLHGLWLEGCHRVPPGIGAWINVGSIADKNDDGRHCEGS